MCSSSKLLEEELKQQCKYPKWAINKKLKEQEERRKRRVQGKNTRQPQKRCHIVIPDTKGLCESYKTICNKYGVQAYFKGGNTLKELLKSPRTKKELRNRATSYIGTNVAGLKVMMKTLGN